MLYLVICRSKMFPMPQGLIDAFIAQCEYCGELQKKGKVKLFAPFASFNGGMAVLDVDSNEEAMQIIGEGPMFPFMEAEVIPLVNDKIAKDGAKALKAKMENKKVQ